MSASPSANFDENEKRPASGDEGPREEVVRVVLADDHAVTRSGIRRLLEANGGVEVVGEAGTGREALTLVRSKQPDVLVLDLEMPEGSGPEVAQRLNSEDAPTRILALSAHESDRARFWDKFETASVRTASPKERSLCDALSMKSRALSNRNSRAAQHLQAADIMMQSH